MKNLLLVFFLGLGVSSWADTASQCTTVLAGTNVSQPTTVQFNNLAWGNSVTLAGPTTINTIWAYCSNSPASIIAGIYTSSAGAPQSLIVQNTAVAAINGWNKLSIPTTVLAAATYWLMYTPSNYYYNDGSTGFTGRVYGRFDYTYNGTFPAAASGQATGSNFAFAIFMDYCAATVPKGNTNTPIFLLGGRPPSGPTPTPVNLVSLIQSPGLYLGGIDSLTANAGQYLDVYRSQLQDHFGNGGRGLINYDSSMGSEEGLSLTTSGGLTWLWTGDGDFTIYPDYWSNAGQGVACGACSNDFIHAAWPDTNFDTTILYYLAQPGGGTFTVGWSNGSSQQNINTSSSVTAVQAVTIAQSSGQSNLYTTSINGKVCIFGEYCGHPNYGVCFSRAAHGGDHVYSHAEILSTARQQWCSLLPNLKGYFIMGGTNDRASMPATTYQTDIHSIVSDIRTAVPKSIIFLCSPVQTSDYNSSNLPAYHTTLCCGPSSESVLSNTYYFDMGAPLVDYTTANTKGFMLDGLHPNGAGVTQIVSDSIIGPTLRTFTRF